MIWNWIIAFIVMWISLFFVVMMIYVEIIDQGKELKEISNFLISWKYKDKEGDKNV